MYKRKLKKKGKESLFDTIILTYFRLFIYFSMYTPSFLFS